MSNSSVAKAGLNNESSYSVVSNSGLAYTDGQYVCNTGVSIINDSCGHCSTIYPYETYVSLDLNPDVSTTTQKIVFLKKDINFSFEIYMRCYINYQQYADFKVKYCPFCGKNLYA